MSEIVIAIRLNPLNCLQEFDPHEEVKYLNFTKEECKGVVPMSIIRKVQEFQENGTKNIFVKLIGFDDDITVKLDSF